MRIVKTEIENLKRFKSWKTDLPAIAIISGKNGRGKSGYLDIIRYCFARGHNEDIIRGGQVEGTCLLTFDDGGQIRVRANREKGETTRGYKKPGAKRFEVSREDIDRIANAISYDPLAFINLPERGTPQKPGQLETLLQVMPIKLDDTEVLDALGDVHADVPKGLNGFDTINAVHKTLYDRRTNVNAQADGLAKHAAELERSLDPRPAHPGGWAKQAQDLRTQQQALESELEQVINEAKDALVSGKEEAEELLRSESDKVNAEIDTAIRALERQRDERLGALEKDKTILVEALRKRANDTVSAASDRLEPKIEALGKDYAVANDRATREANAEITRNAAKVAADQAALNKAESQAITDALTRLGALKASLAKRLDIPDVEIENGRICKRNDDGALIPFNSWNTVAKMMFCLKIGVLAHGEAGFLLCDECEHFDQENRDALMEAVQYYAEEKGLQFIMAFVGDSDEIVVAEG